MARIQRSLVLMLVTLLGVAIVSSAGAQPPPEGPRGPRGRVMGGMMRRAPGPGSGLLGLLRLEEVRKELALSEEQQSQLQNLARELRPRGLGGPGGLRDMPPEERQAKIQELREKAKRHTEMVRGRLKKILDPDQIKRLKQIGLQVRMKMRGAGVLVDKELAEQLGITDEQKEKLREVRKGIQEKLRSLREELRGLEPPERREKFEELKKEASEAAFGILTSEQKEKLETLKGDPFELDIPKMFKGRRMQLGGPRGVGPRGGGPRGGGPRGGRPYRGRPRGGGPPWSPHPNPESPQE